MHFFADVVPDHPGNRGRMYSTHHVALACVKFKVCFVLQGLAGFAPSSRRCARNELAGGKFRNCGSIHCIDTLHCRFGNRRSAVVCLTN